MKNLSKVETGLLVSIYKTGKSDTTNKGLSYFFDELILIGSGVTGPFEPGQYDDYLVLLKRPIFGDFICVPKSVLDSGKDYMFGGNFAYASDSRFPYMVPDLKCPIKIFDRVE
jgi:hypothetical protein